MGYYSMRPMDADSQPERFYAGEFRHSIDEKNRITIPSRWRRDHPENFILLPEATHQFLLVMSPMEFAKMSLAAETNEKVSARDRRVFLRQLHSRAQHEEIRKAIPIQRVEKPKPAERLRKAAPAERIALTDGSQR